MTAPTIKTCPNGLRKTMLVSFPRSGHHLLVRGLTEALDHKLVYSEYYSCAHNMSNCEYVNLQKSHDFDLTDPIDPELNYIVLWRGFEDATLSWWKASDTGLTLEEFRESKRAYYDGFVAKWIGNEIDDSIIVGWLTIPNGLNITYESLTKYPDSAYIYAANSIGNKVNTDKLVDFIHKELPNAVPVSAFSGTPIPA